MPKPNKPTSGKDGMNFVQLIRTKTKKAVCSALSKVNHIMKHCNCHKESDSDSDLDYWSVGLDSTGSLHVVKKTKTSTSLVDTHSWPIKAILCKNSNKPVDPPEDVGVTALVAIMEPLAKIFILKGPTNSIKESPQQ